MNISWNFCSVLFLLFSLNAIADEFTLYNIQGQNIGSVELHPEGNHAFLVKKLTFTDEYRQSRFFDASFDSAVGHSLKRPWLVGKKFTTKYKGTIDIVGLAWNANFEITLEPYSEDKLAPEHRRGAEWMLQIIAAPQPGTWAHALRAFLVPQSSTNP